MASSVSRKRSKRSTKRSKKGKAVHIDVRSMKDVRKFMHMMKRQSIWLVLVYADWCGHCTHYKNDHWNRMKAMHGRKIPMAQINETMYRKTPVGSATINGYPTVLMLKKGTPHTEIKDPKNVEMMNKLVTTEPEEVEAEMPAVPDAVVPETEPAVEPVAEQEETVTNMNATPNATERNNDDSSFSNQNERSEQSAEIVRNSQSAVSIPESTNEGNTITGPPNASDDLIRNAGETLTPGANATMVGNVSNAGLNAEKPKIGGSLYASLLKAAAPAVILTGVATMSKRRRGRKTHRRRRV